MQTQESGKKSGQIERYTFALRKTYLGFQISKCTLSIMEKVSEK
jgi:hypothetical protein